MMAKLAEVGFSQSYTYFTWRHESWELREYVDELTPGPLAEYMRPSFWPNTPDILDDVVLRNAPPAAFALRFVLAATLVPVYGVYSGYELLRERTGQRDEHRVPALREVRGEGPGLRRRRLAGPPVPHG